MSSVRRIAWVAASVALALAASAAAGFTPEPGPQFHLKVYQLKYRRAEEGALQARRFISRDGTLLVQPRTNSLTVRDTEANLRQITEALRIFDRAPDAYRVTIQVIRASHQEKPPEISPEIKAVGARLGHLLSYNSFELLDSIVVDGMEGDSILYQMGQDYSVSFVMQGLGAGESVLALREFVLSRKRPGKGRDLYSKVLNAQVNMRLNQTMVLGASRLEGSTQAVVLVLFAERRGAVAAAAEK